MLKASLLLNLAPLTGFLFQSKEEEKSTGSSYHDVSLVVAKLGPTNRFFILKKKEEKSSSYHDVSLVVAELGPLTGFFDIQEQKRRDK